MAPLVPVPVAVASVTFTPAGGDAPFTATFHADVLGSLKPFVYAGDFGDGSLSDGSLVPMHTFTGPGNYTIKVTVRDTSGTIDSGTVSVLVGQPAGISSYIPYILVLAVGLGAVGIVYFYRWRKRKASSGGIQVASGREPAKKR